MWVASRTYFSILSMTGNQIPTNLVTPRRGRDTPSTPSQPAQSMFNGNWFWITLLVSSALVVRSAGLSHLSMTGDEILSLRDATELGRTWNGIGYFVVLRFVLLFTNESLWLRLPSVVLGAAA